MLAYLRNGEIAVLGAGRSGVSAARLLLEKGAHVSIYDDLHEEKLSHWAGANLANSPKLRKFLGNKNPELRDNTKALILSPGIPLNHALVQCAKRQGLPILNEIDLAYSLMPDAKIVGITGTNGKSTTTVMMESIIRQ